MYLMLLPIGSFLTYKMLNEDAFTILYYAGQTDADETFPQFPIWFN